MVTLDVPASAFVHVTILSNEEAVEEGQSLIRVGGLAQGGGASPNILQSSSPILRQLHPFMVPRFLPSTAV